MPFKFTAFQKAAYEDEDAILTKVIRLGDDGKPVSDGSACRMLTGRAKVVTLDSVTDFAKIISNLESDLAIGLGVFDEALADAKGGVNVTTSKRLPPDHVERKFIARTKRFLRFSTSASGLLCVDFDIKGATPEVLERLKTAGSAWALLEKLYSVIGTVARVMRASTSAGLYNSETGEKYPGSGGAHYFLQVADPADIPRALKVIHDRCWLNGLGWFRLGAAAQLLERSIVDVSVGSPERLLFEGKPVLVPPMAQDAKERQAVAYEGAVLNSRTAFPNLTDTERREVEHLKANAKKALAKAAYKLREEIFAKRAEEMSKKTGMTVAACDKALRRGHDGILLPPTVIVFDDPDLGEVTVKEILADSAKYAEETCGDPLEPEYGRCKAVVLPWHPGQPVVIHSLAHGMHRVFTCVYDLATTLELLEALPKDATGEDTLRVLDKTMADPRGLNETETSEIIHEAGKRLKARGVGIRDIKKRIKRVQKEHAEATHRHSENHAGEEDGAREVIWRARADAPVREVTEEIERVLMARGDVESPPFRTLSGTLAYMHQNAEAMAVEGATDTLPAVRGTGIREMDVLQCQLFIERYINFKQELKDPETGATYVIDVCCAPGHANALVFNYESRLPRIASVVGMPMVHQGQVISKKGIDAELKLMFQVDPAFTAIMPTQAESDLDYCKAAVAFMLDEWLVDVDTDMSGKAVMIALALTLIQRHILPSRPIWYFGAARQQGGKTTSAQMIHAAVTGLKTEETPWPVDPEERRKKAFAALRQGPSMILWDNILTGTSVADATLEMMATSAAIEDRVLGESRVEKVACTSPQVFTGNRLVIGGDMLTRVLKVNIDCQLENPAERKFKHPDILRWTLENRAQLLNGLYAILMLDTQGYRSATPTRFTDWQAMIGDKVEYLMQQMGHAGFSFGGHIGANADADPETEASRSVMAWIAETWPTGEFMASDIAEMLEIGAKPDPNDLGGTARWMDEKSRRTELRELLTLAGGGVELGYNPSAVKVGNKLNSLEGRPVRIETEQGRVTVKLRKGQRRERDGGRIWYLDVVKDDGTVEVWGEAGLTMAKRPAAGKREAQRRSTVFANVTFK